MLPEKIGRYEILAELGRGAMGVVYRAKDPAIGRTVALKTLRLDNSAISHEELVRRFQQEARSAGALNHRNIVTIYDAGESENNFFIAMEYLEGRTLAELLLQQRSLNSDTVAEIGAQICAGLAYAHQHGVVHRDVKPANIMITDESVVKIMDFGIAKVEASLTMTGQVLGTPDYMSPEQVKGNHLDGRSDLFSLGVILYEMATGERPFVGQTVTTVMYKIVHEAPIPPERLDTSIPEGLGGIVMRALAKAPEARFQSARQMADALRSYRSLPAFHEAATVGVTALNWPPQPASIPASTLPIAGPGDVVAPKKRRGRLFAIAALVLLITGGLSLYMRSGHEAKTSQTPARQDSRVPAAEEPLQPPLPPTASENHSGRSRSQSPSSVTVPGVGSVEIPDIAKSFPGAEDSDFGKAIKDKVMAGIAGQLVVSTNPREAKVEIDGKSQDRTSPVASLSPGLHQVVISMPGYQTMRMSVPIAPARTYPVNVSLVPMQGPPNEGKETGRLLVQTKPQDATVNLKGPVEMVGLLTPVDLSLPPGKYRATVLLEGYLPLSRDFEIKPGKTSKIKETLKISK